VREFDLTFVIAGVQNAALPRRAASVQEVGAGGRLWSLQHKLHAESTVYRPF